jgi:hypothetical protein
MDDLATRIREYVDDAAPVGLDEVVDRPPSRPRRGRPVLVLVAAAAVVIVVAAGVGFALRDDGSGPSVAARSGGGGFAPLDWRSQPPDLGIGQVWPGPDASPDGRATPVEAALRFVRDVGLGPVDRVHDPGAPDGGPVWVEITQTDGYAFRVLFARAADGGYAAMQVGEDSIAMSSDGSLGITAGSVSYAWRDDDGVHGDIATGPAELQLPVTGSLASVLAVLYDDGTGHVVGVAGAHFGPAVGTWTPPPTLPAITIPPATTPTPRTATDAISDDERAIREAFLGWLDTKPREAAGTFIEDWDSISSVIDEAQASAPLPLDAYHGRVESVEVLDDDEARVVYSFLNGEAAVVPNQVGRAVKIGGEWKVSRDTVCAAFAIGGVQCPPRS